MLCIVLLLINCGFLLLFFSGIQDILEVDIEDEKQLDDSPENF